MSDDSFAGKVALVTGGGTGIGRSAALMIAERGCRVVISGRTASTLEAVKADNGNIECVVADMAKTDDVKALAERAIEWGGRLDIVVNNAGMFGMSPVDSVESEFLDQMWRTNITGPMLLIRYCLAELAKAEGTVVNVSSTMAQKAGAGATAYCASKAALEHVTRCLALELAPQKIRVNCVAPGPVDTPILSKSGFSPEMVEAANKQLAESVPLSRIGQPEDVARWIVNLADPGATWIAGEIIRADGGYGVV